jgi:tetratricopeptide (TPR) repeat protein
MAYNFAENNAILLSDIDAYNCLQHGIAQSADTEISPIESHQYFDIYRHWHNLAVKTYYGETINFVNVYQIKDFYQKALDFAPNDEYRAFTTKHFSSLLLDADDLGNAEVLLENSINKAISDDAKFELMNIQYSVWLKQLGIPYDNILLSKIKNTLWEVLQYYEKQQNKVQIALLLIDAAQVANISESFTESLGYISRAVDMLKKEDIPELLANAQYRKGVLFYTWAQSGNIQFYKSAMEAYQEALKVFTYDNAPDVFAEIQHHLGVIYSEIPDEAKKKSLWAAVSVSSFNQALNHFTRETHPFEYAMICNSYANALTKYPPSVKSDNHAKALNLYRQALEIRSASEYPYERALTILNFLEASWYVNHADEQEEHMLFNEMIEKANEIEHLTDDPKLLADAQQHLEKIHELSKVMV